jgi:hypothetical protein
MLPLLLRPAERWRARVPGTGVSPCAASHCRVLVRRVCRGAVIPEPDFGAVCVWGPICVRVGRVLR